MRCRVMIVDVRLRAATSGDLEFLCDMLVEAFNWDGERRFTRDELMAHDHAARYLDGWCRDGDFGLVAVDGDARLGAIWARVLPETAPGYGYVAADVPELSMGVCADRRGQGVGSALLAGCVEQARGLGRRALSLSVEDGNLAARALYERNGFVVVGRSGDSDTMVLDLGQEAVHGAD
jgi:GNAT superfamily N-acetyltransferase